MLLSCNFWAPAAYQQTSFALIGHPKGAELDSAATSSEKKKHSTSSVLGPSIFHGALFWYTFLHLCTFLIVRDYYFQSHTKQRVILPHAQSESQLGPDLKKW
jgi:hypothetical protein